MSIIIINSQEPGFPTLQSLLNGAKPAPEQKSKNEIPGVAAWTNTYLCDHSSRITVGVPCQGAGTYTLKIGHNITDPKIVVRCEGGDQQYTGGAYAQYVPVSLTERRTLD